MIDQKETGNKVVSSDFLKVLLKLKENIMRDLNVADIAIVNTIKDNGDIYCKLLNNSSITIVCTKLSNITVTENDCVLILYINDDFRTNLSRYKNNQQLQNTSSSNLHNKNYGVIIGLL